MNTKPPATAATEPSDMENAMAATLLSLTELHAHLRNGMTLRADDEGNWGLTGKDGKAHHCEAADAALSLLQHSAERYLDCLEMVDAMDRGAIQ